jgi:hypothetical protein
MDGVLEGFIDYVEVNNPDGRAVSGVGVKPLDFWDGGFEFR